MSNGYLTDEQVRGPFETPRPTDYSALPKMAVENPPGSGQFREATIGECVAWLRDQGVGEVVEQCVDHVQDWLGRHTSGCRFSPALVISVSDGGSET